VEMLFGGEWGTVCDDGFRLTEAQVVCEQLGLGNATEYRYSGAAGAGSGKILLDQVRCQGTEAALSQCAHAPFFSNDCQHYEDVVVVCTGAGSNVPPPPPPGCPGRELTLKISTGYQSTDTPVLFDQMSPPLRATEETTTCDINFPEEAGSAVWGADEIHLGEHFAAEISGYLNITTAGSYTFWLESDDGAVLYIDGKEVTDTRGIHGMWESRPGLLDLTAEKHRFVVTFFQNTGDGPGLIASWQGPGINKQVIPSSAFSSTAPCSLNMDVKTDFTGTEAPTSFADAGLTADESASVCEVNFAPESGEINWGGVILHNHFAVEITGYIKIELGGEYKFFLSSDDGSKLYINNWLVVDNDNHLDVHASDEQEGHITLAVGSHAIRITMFENTGVAGLVVKYQGVGLPSVPKQVIPASAFTSTAPHKETSYAVRLADGPDDMEGRLEINYNGQWGSVCDDHFTMVDANVACNQLGFGYAAKIASRYMKYNTQYKQWMGSSEGTSDMIGSGPIWMDELTCLGNETALSDCKFGGDHSPAWGFNDCQHYEDVWLQCSNVRLAGGHDETEGRLEVYHDGEWGTVCNNPNYNFGQGAANVVCAQLGAGNAKWVGRAVTSTAGTGPILMDEVFCAGDEHHLSECSFAGWGRVSSTCSHAYDTEITCAAATAPTAAYPMRLVPASPVQNDVTWTEHHAMHCWDTKSVLAPLSDVNEAKALCAETTSCYGIYASDCSSTNTTYGYTLCTSTPDSWRNFTYAEKMYYGTAAIEGTCIMEKQSTHLESEGRLEVYYQGEWGTVCDDGFAHSEASVACREMGLGPAQAVGSVSPDNQGSAQQHIWLDDMQCQGNEGLIQQCAHRPWGSNDCSHREDVRISCTPPSPTPTPGTTPSPVPPVVDPTPSPTPPPGSPTAGPTKMPTDVNMPPKVLSFVALLDGVYAKQFTGEIKAAYDLAVQDWVDGSKYDGTETVCKTGCLKITQLVESNATDSADHTVSISTYVTVLGDDNAQKALASMSRGSEVLQYNLRHRGGQLDELSHAELTLTSPPSLGKVVAKPVVIGAVSLMGLGKESFAPGSEQLGFRTVIAQAAGSVCGNMGAPRACGAKDVEIMDYSSLDRRETGVRIKFVMEVDSKADADKAAATLTKFLHDSARFTAALVAQGDGLAKVTGTAVDMDPTASKMGPPPVHGKGDDDDKASGGGSTGLVVALCIVSALLLVGCIMGAVYLVKKDKLHLDMNREEESARIFSGSDQAAGGIFTIPTAEVIGVSGEPSQGSFMPVNSSEGGMSMQDFPGARPPKYDDDEERESFSKLEDGRL